MKVTQSEVDKEFIEIKKAWDKKVSESKKTEQMFIATDATGWVSSFLYKYTLVKEGVEAQGLTIPELVKGLEVSYT